MKDSHYDVNERLNNFMRELDLKIYEVMNMVLPEDWGEEWITEGSIDYSNEEVTALMDLSSDISKERFRKLERETGITTPQAAKILESSGVEASDNLALLSSNTTIEAINNSPFGNEDIVTIFADHGGDLSGNIDILKDEIIVETIVKMRKIENELVTDVMDAVHDFMEDPLKKINSIERLEERKLEGADTMARMQEAKEKRNGMVAETVEKQFTKLLNGSENTPLEDPETTQENAKVNVISFSDRFKAEKPTDRHH